MNRCGSIGRSSSIRARGGRARSTCCAASGAAARRASAGTRTDGTFEKTQVLQLPLLNDLSSFGEDESAELYAIGFADNNVYRITPVIAP